ncbi:MAG: penicillin-binding transpeptidase domain-containing protein, partial [Bacteroidota bacterium]
LFDWKRGGAVDTLLAPLDSLRHYFTLLNAGVLAADPATGVIKAWVGGIDHRFVYYDHVKSRRQVGSVIKPIVYATALTQGMRPCEYTPAQRMAYEDYNNYNPGNAGGKYEGVYSMRGGLTKSVNTVAVNIAVRTGLDKVVDQAHAMGLTAEVKPIPSIALGTVEASLLEMVAAYSAFANRGKLPIKRHYLDRIETAEGEIIVSFDRPTSKDTKPVLSDSVSALATYLMAGVVNKGTGARLRSTYGLRGALAGKTGTTQDQSDGWFLGFTPKLVVGSWVGAEYPAVHFRTLSRGSATATALPLWGNFMRRVARDKALKAYHGGGFQPLDEMTLALLQCPDYLEEMPFFYTDSIRGDVRLREIDPTLVLDMMRRKPQRDNESSEDYVARIERQLAKEERREERRKKRKNFWGKVLFGNKKDDDGR